jgi:hypothetical protein
MPCFAAFGHAASRHMISAANLVRTLGESAFFNHTLFGRGIARGEPRRHEMIFERTGPSWYSCAVFAAWVGLSRDAGTACTARARGFPDFTLMCAGRRSGSPRLRCARSAREAGQWQILVNGRSGHWQIWAMADLGNGMSAGG